MNRIKQLSIALFILPLLFACANTGSNEVDPATQTTDQTAPADTVAYTGVVIDAAMNSLFLKVPSGDTLSFGYPELDRAKIQSFQLNDTLTVNTVADTVVTIINQTKK